jgi:outer membrane protein
MMQQVAVTLFTGAALLLGGTVAQAEDLLEIYHSAQESDPQLLAAEAGNQAAQEVRAQNRAALLPQINLQANVNQNSIDLLESNTGAATGEESYTSNDYTLSLVQSLYHHEYYVQLRQADARIAQANAEYENAKQGLILRAADAYFNLLAAQDSLSSAEATKRAFGQQLRQTQQRFDVGLSAITDVHEAQAAYDSAVAAELAAQSQLDAKRENLREIIGRDPDALAILKEDMPLLPPEPTDIQQWVDKAQQQNLSLLAAEASARAAEEELNRRRAGHYPTLDLIGRHNYSDTTDYTYGSEQVNNTIGIQLNVPIYSGGLTTAQTREARALYTQAQEAHEQQRRATVRETRSAYLNVTTGISQVLARKQALASAQTALEATQAGFEVGTRTIVDVLDAQRLRDTAQTDYLRARYDYLLATLQLKQATGSLGEMDIAQINEWLE